MDGHRHTASATVRGNTVETYKRSQTTTPYVNDARGSSFTGLSKQAQVYSSHSGIQSRRTSARVQPGFGHQAISSSNASAGVVSPYLQPLQTRPSLHSSSHTLTSIPSSTHPIHHSSESRVSALHAPSQRRRSSSASRVAAIGTAKSDATAAAMTALQESLTDHHMTLSGSAHRRSSRSIPHSDVPDMLTTSASRQLTPPYPNMQRSLADPQRRVSSHKVPDLTASMSTTTRSVAHSRTRTQPLSPHAVPGKVHTDSSANSLRSCSTAMQDQGTTAASMMSTLSIGSAMSTTSPHALRRPVSASRPERQRSDALMDTSSSAASCATVPPTIATQLQRQAIDKLPPVDMLQRLGGVPGLYNLGNTCFMASVLQCLAVVPDVLRFVLGGAAEPTIRDPTVAPAFKHLLHEFASSRSGRTVVPRALRDAMARLDRRWGAGSQQDSHEFLLALLERLQAECDRTPGKPKYRELTGEGSADEQAAEAAAYAREWSNSWVDDCFGGLLQSTVKCRECGAESHCFDASMDLGLPVPQVAPGEAVPLERCLRAFTEREELDAVYRCDGCGADTRRLKALRVYTPPRTLVLHLKRFSHRGSGGGASLGRRAQFAAMRKDSTEVIVPARLNLEPFCNPAGLRACRQRAEYKLIAVSEHVGGMGGGHYTASVREPLRRSWLHCNDASVSNAPRPDGRSSSAYVLFYRLM